ncbi:MAG TPA: transporter [Salinimicrobium sp.]|nr:transporter [Salinimicrobium sp.]
MRFPLIAFLFFFFSSYFSHAQYTETINSNRPGNSQGAFSVGTGVLQLEAGAILGRDEHSILNTETDLWGVEYSLRYGVLFEQLEVNIMGSYLDQTTSYITGSGIRERHLSNFDANAVGLKYLVFDPYKKGVVGREVNLYSWKANQKFDWSQLIPAVSLYAGVNFSPQDNNPFLSPGESQYTPRFAVITQNNWAGGWVFVLNIIADKIGYEFPTYMGIATLTHSFNPKFAAFGEFQGIMSDIYSDEIVRAGLAYLFHKNFQVDASGLLNFKDTPSRWQVAFGLSYRLDMHKKEEFLDTETEL